MSRNLHRRRETSETLGLRATVAGALARPGGTPERSHGRPMAGCREVPVTERAARTYYLVSDGRDGTEPKGPVRTGASVRKILAVTTTIALLGVLGAVALTSRAVGADVTSFSISVNGRSSDAVVLGAGATLAEAGLPGAATGTVTYTDSLGDTVCAGDLPTTTCDAPADLVVGTYVISATYSGDGTYSGSTSTNSISLTVLAPTTTVLSVNPSSAASGSSVGFSATVTSTYGAPSGTVTFRTPAKLLCSAVLSSGSAACTATTAPVGVDTITAAYLGDASFSRSTSQATLTVYRAAASLACSKAAGKSASQIKFAHCTPFSTHDRVAFAPGSFVRSGGTLTWRRSGQSAVVTASSTSPGQGACPAKFSEVELTGTITGGTSQYALVGDPVSIDFCVSNRTGAVRLLAGSTAQL